MVTPSLNKSFKFQSDWPKNSSQAYLLQAILNDLENTKKVGFETKDDGYILTADVNYPNNPDLTTEKIYFNKNMDIKMVEVFNDSGIVKIKVIFDTINYKANIDEKTFELSSIINENAVGENTEQKKESCKNEDGTTNKECEESCKNEDGTTDVECENSKEKTSSKITDILYPLYIPANTYLTKKDSIEITGGERVILNFAGDKNFILVEETVSIPNELEVIPVYGDPIMINDTIAALSGSSLHWTKNNVDYYLTSDNLNAAELMTIAESLANTTAVNELK